MQTRKSEFSGVSNPATRFLEWRSEPKAFQYFDKGIGENVKVELPFRFMVLKEMHTIKGYHEQSESGIYSNEVARLANDVLVVRAFKGGELAKGLYADIKDKIVAKGARYAKSVYVMDQDGTLVNLQLVGAACGAWMDFSTKTKKRFGDEWVVVKSANDAKKGATKYSIPVFEFDGVASKEECDKADALYTELYDYLSEYLRRGAPQAATTDDIDVVDAEEVSADLPF